MTDRRHPRDARPPLQSASVPFHSDIMRRKADHIDVVLSQDVGFGGLTTGLDRYRFVHEALPELSLRSIDISADWCGRHLSAPLLISSMTGGPDRADRINRHLAEAAEALKLGLALGSQRIALEHQGAGGLSGEIRNWAPSVPIWGNIGAAQLLGSDAADRVRRAREMIDADGLFIHLNPLQEAVQSGGDTDWRGVLSAIERVAGSGVPLAVKEVGFGLSENVIRRLTDAGVSTLDIAGAGGTNWARVEGARAVDRRLGAVSAHFTDWGIPTTDALIGARRVAPSATIIASGGIKSGVDVAKALRLGADLVGQAAATLAAAVDSTEAVISHFEDVIETLRVVCFCTGSKDLAALRQAPLQRPQATNF